MKTIFKELVMKAFCMSFLLAALGATPLFSAPWDSLTAFPNMAWIGPPVTSLNAQTIGDMVDAGLTVSLAEGGVSREENLRALDSAQKYGIKLLIADDRWGWYSGFGGPMPTDSHYFDRLDSIVDDYKNHPAYYGLFIIDEPSGGQYHQIKLIRDHILQRDPDHLVYINWAVLSEAGINMVMDTINPQVLSFDTYPVGRTGCNANFYNVLEDFRRGGLRYNVPVWAFSMSIRLDGWPLPTKGTMAIQQYSNLAYGFKGLQYFTYANVIGPAPVERNGTRTPLYYIFKELNTEIMKIAPLLKGMASLGVTHSLPLPEGTRGFSPDSCIQYTTGAPVLAGWFKDNANQPYVLLVNREYLVPGTARLFTKQVAGLVEVSKQTGAELSEIIPTDNNILLDFAPGEGRLFRIVKSAVSDADKPSMDTVCAMPPDSVVVVFSERVNRTTAENASNYTIDNGVQINGAQLRDDSATVALSVTALSRDVVYTLQASGVQDLSGKVMDADSRTFQWHSCILDWSFDQGLGDTVQDASGLGNTGLRFWEADWQDGISGKALNFTGGNVTAGPAAFTNIVNSFTMMCWVNPTRTRDSTAEQTSSYYWGTTLPYTVAPYGGGMYGTNHAGAGISVGTNGVSVCELDDDAPYPYHSPALLVYQAPITDWTHVAVVYDNKQTKLYLNGALVRTGLTSVKTVHPSGQIGINYNGGIDEYKVFSYALSQAEIDSVLEGQSTISGARFPANQPFSMETSPSPFTSSVRIKMNRAVAPGSKLLVVGTDGRVVADLSRKLGSKEILWNPTRCGAGVYFLKLTQGKKIYTGKLIAIR